MDSLSLASDMQQQLHYPEFIQFKMTDGSVQTIKRTDKKLGQGGQASVFLAIDEDDKEYAIKIFDLLKYKRAERELYKNGYDRELELLQKIVSPYVVRLYGHASSSDNNRHYLLLEYFHSDLQKLI